MKKTLRFLTTLICVTTFFPVIHGYAQSCTGFRTQTQGGWGAVAHGSNPGTYRDKNFAAAFPNGLTIGCTNKIILTTAKAVEDFLPSGSTPAVLPGGTKTNPGGSYSNVFAGQLVTAVLNVGFDLYDPNFSSNSIHTGDLVITSGKFAGMTINQLIAEANKVIGGCSTAYTPSDLNGALDAFNSNYDDGTSDKGFTKCPPDCAFIANGIATATGAQCFKLTGTDFHTVGSVFSNKTIDLSQSFEINASMYFGVNNDGGDGIAFVLQSEGPNYIGNFGAGIGYHRFDGITGCFPADNPGPVSSFIVEFDTYQNGIIGCSDIGDPAGDHIGFMSHSDAYHTSSDALSSPVEFPSNIEDGQYHDVKFSWNVTTKTMTVSFLSQTYSYTGDIVNKLFNGNSKVYWGFTGSNGSVSPNEHDVCIKTSCAPAQSVQTSQNNSATAYKQPVQKGISVSPNPSPGAFKVSFDNMLTGTVRIAVCNSNGTVIDSKNIILSKGQVLSFDLTRYGKGLYFIKATSNSGEQVQKVLIQ